VKAEGVAACGGLVDVGVCVGGAGVIVGICVGVGDGGIGVADGSGVGFITVGVRDAPGEDVAVGTVVSAAVEVGCGVPVAGVVGNGLAVALIWCGDAGRRSGAQLVKVTEASESSAAITEA